MPLRITHPLLHSQLWAEEDKREGHVLNWAPSHMSCHMPLAQKRAVSNVANGHFIPPSYDNAARSLLISFVKLQVEAGKDHPQNLC